MILAQLVLGAPDWMVPSVVLAALALLTVIWSYWRSETKGWVRLCAGLLKATGIVALATCLIEPLFSRTRARPGANLFVLLADNSQSLQIRDPDEEQTRGEQLKDRLIGGLQGGREGGLLAPRAGDPTRGANRPRSAWQTRLGQDFDVRRYIFDTRLRPVSDFSELSFEGAASALASSLRAIASRYRDRPSAGVLLFTDGNATDFGSETFDWSQLPPIYPVLIGDDAPTRDISVSRVSVSQTNFEAAPVTVSAEVNCHGMRNEDVVIQLLDESGVELERQIVRAAGQADPITHRFQLRPEKQGVQFYQVRAYREADDGGQQQLDMSSEATAANNSRWVMVDRGGGPYRVLYVSGRPNWEFKFLRRSIAADDEVNLVGLVRIAKREPKFTYRGRAGERTNPLYRGFGNQDDEQAEEYDEPVYLRLGTEDAEELRDGFPKAADQLFRYHALVIDDLEADFFTQDQMSLVQQFVSQRGGGLLMLGGQQSFAKGGYERTPIGELLPVYLDRLPAPSTDVDYRILLTRDGWLQPWMRLRTTEENEKKRLGQMPGFKVLSRVESIKPGATVLAQASAGDGSSFPALVAQQFGKGRAGALLLGDLWRWQLRRTDVNQDDLEKAWRQTIRWLVADVPQRVEVETRRAEEQPSAPMEVSVRVYDPKFEPLDNASVLLRVNTPDKREIELRAQSSDESPGTYVTSFVPRERGVYRASVEVSAEDGSEVGQRETGWTSEPAADEFAMLQPNRALLERIAEKTGGEMTSSDRLDQFVNSLPHRRVPVVEPWSYPLWHQWSVFLFALACFIGEWGLRRIHGLP